MVSYMLFFGFFGVPFWIFWCPFWDFLVSLLGFLGDLYISKSKLLCAFYNVRNQVGNQVGNQAIYQGIVCLIDDIYWKIIFLKSQTTHR